ncbi:MAG TPA: PhnD/SsuA/transferrin family substrate-binding protein [Ktedonobacteraceae bacterium]
MESIDDNAVTIHFATFLSPILYGTYEHIARYIGGRLSCPTTLRVGQSFDEFTEGQIDVAFICGLPYVRMTSRNTCPVELLAAPVLMGKRYLHRPIYFSDVIVRSDSPYTSFDDLGGCVWAYNELASHSGCNLVCYSLLERNRSPEYFGETVKSGSHLRSIEMVLHGEVDASAIDSHLMDVLLSKDEKLSSRLRVVEVLGPSSIPPIVVSKRLDDELKCKMQEALVTMHLDNCGAKGLREGLIERFVMVTDEDYGDLRGMLDRVEVVEFPFE